jgi:hypothetical protein
MRKNQAGKPGQGGGENAKCRNKNHSLLHFASNLFFLAAHHLRVPSKHCRVCASKMLVFAMPSRTVG